MDRKTAAARHAARITRELRRLFPDAMQQYERECITTKVFRLADNHYILRVTWERLDGPQATETRNRLQDLANETEHARVIRYSRFDADVEVIDVFDTELTPGQVREAQEAISAASMGLPQQSTTEAYQARLSEETELLSDKGFSGYPGVKPRPREVDLLVTPDEMIRVWSGSRMNVGGLGLDEDRDGVKYFLRLPTVEEFYQMGHESRIKLVAMGVPDNFPPELPRHQVERIVAPMPDEMARKLLGIPDYH